MFIVFLKFTENKKLAAKFMQSHLDWVTAGIDDGMFLFAASLMSGDGGCIVTNKVSEDVLKQYVKRDPFVVESIVSADFVEIKASITQPELQRLLE